MSTMALTLNDTNNAKMSICSCSDPTRAENVYTINSVTKVCHSFFCAKGKTMEPTTSSSEDVLVMVELIWRDSSISPGIGWGLLLHHSPPKKISRLPTGTKVLLRLKLSHHNYTASNWQLRTGVQRGPFTTELATPGRVVWAWEGSIGRTIHLRRQ